MARDTAEAAYSTVWEVQTFWILRQHHTRAKINANMFWVSQLHMPYWYYHYKYDFSLAKIALTDENGTTYFLQESFLTEIRCSAKLIFSLLNNVGMVLWKAKVIQFWNLPGGIPAWKLDHNTSWNSTRENAILQVTAGRNPGYRVNSCLQLSQYSISSLFQRETCDFCQSLLLWEKMAVCRNAIAGCFGVLRKKRRMGVDFRQSF